MLFGVISIFILYVFLTWYLESEEPCSISVCVVLSLFILYSVAVTSVCESLCTFIYQLLFFWTMILNHESLNLSFPPPQACSRGPSPRAAQPCPAGPSVFSQLNMPGCWPVRWAATWRTQWSLWVACRENITRSWLIKTSSRPATTLPLGLLSMETLYQTTLRYSWSKVPIHFAFRASNSQLRSHPKSKPSTRSLSRWIPQLWYYAGSEPRRGPQVRGAYRGQRKWRAG